MRLLLATGPASWGVDFADTPANPPWRSVLDETAAAGFEWTELGPLGYLPEEGDELRRELSARNLRAAGAVVFEPLHDASERDAVLAVAARTSRLLKAVGGRYLVIIDRVSEERSATAGRREVAPRLESWALLKMIETVNRVAALAHDHELRPVIHSHAGSYIEFEDELTEILDRIGPMELGVCIDTGHFAFAGISMERFLSAHAARVEYLHLKDVRGSVREEAIATRMDYWAAIGSGIFCPLGKGIAEFESLRHGLQEFNGHATIEQDKDPEKSSDVLSDLRSNLSVARTLLEL